MKYAVPAFLWLTLLCVVPVQAEQFQLGQTTLEVPAPKGFVNATAEIKDQFPFQQILAETKRQGANICFYLPEKTVAELREGALFEPERFFMLQIQEKNKRVSYSAADFAMFKLAAKENHQKRQAMREQKLKQSTNSLSRELSREVDQELTLEVTESTVFEPHFESINELASSKYVASGLQVNGEDAAAVRDVNAHTLTFLNPGGKLIVLDCVAPKKQLEWTRAASRDWAAAILAENPMPSPFKQVEKPDQRNRIIQGTLIALAVIAVLAFIVKQKRKRAASLEEENETAA
jgi:predicted methyltransferase